MAKRWTLRERRTPRSTVDEASGYQYIEQPQPRTFTDAEIRVMRLRLAEEMIELVLNEGTQLPTNLQTELCRLYRSVGTCRQHHTRGGGNPQIQQIVAFESSSPRARGRE